MTVTGEMILYELAREPAAEFGRSTLIVAAVVGVSAAIYFSISAIWHYYQPQIYRYLFNPISGFEISILSFDTMDYNGTVDLIIYAYINRNNSTCGNRRETWYFDRNDGVSYVRKVFDNNENETRMLTPGRYVVGPWRIKNVPFDAIQHRAVISYDCPGIDWPVRTPVGPWPLDLSGYSPW